MTRVQVWPADDSGCGHYRLRLPARALADQGADVTINTTGPRVLWDRRWTGEQPPLDANALGIDRPPDADVVVLQRPGRKHWAQVIPHLQAAGIRVVVDIDDDFEHIPAGNTAAAGYDPTRNPHHSHRWIRAAAELADLVTVTTPTLALRYQGTGRVSVLPNLVPAAYLDVHAERDGRTCGWSGSVDTHPRDLEATGGAVRRALDSTGGDFHVIGTGKGVRERLDLAVEPSATGWVPFDEYPAELARLDVAVVPLHRHPFNEAKSALKMAECAALGVAVVASPTDDNTRLHRAGVGLLADTPDDWQQLLVTLLRDGAFRDDLAGRSREAMAAHTYEGHADRWWAAWTGR